MQLRLPLRLAGVEGAYRRDETSVTAGSINWSGIWDRTADLIPTGMGGGLGLVNFGNGVHIQDGAEHCFNNGIFQLTDTGSITTNI